MVSCKICKSYKTTFYHKIEKYNYYFCPRCLTIFLCHQPNINETNNYYRNKFEYSDGRLNENIMRSRSKIILKNLSKLNRYGKTLLDIGAGLGFFVEEAKKVGLKVIGIDPSKNFTPNAVLNINFEEFIRLHPQKKFDFITLIHVIEHVRDPIIFLHQALTRLNQNGVLYIETPNLDSHLFRFEGFSYTFLTPPQHLWLFSIKSFIFITKNWSGFLIKKIATYSYPQHFMGILKSILYAKNKTTLPAKNTRKITVIKSVKTALFDNLFAKIFYRLLNIGNKGSILELYIKKK